jgi:hypothetical protein
MLSCVTMGFLFSRRRRIVLNDVENIPLGVAVAWGSLQVAHSPRAHVGLVLLFAASRYSLPRCYVC